MAPYAQLRDSSGAQSALLLLAYGAAFALLHQLSQAWATAHFYSLWFAPAGLRMAFLWARGAIWAPILAIAEALGLWVAGVYALEAPADLLRLGSILGPPLGYGIAVALAHGRFKSSSSALSPSTLNFGLVALLAPLLGFVGSVAWRSALPGHDSENLLTQFLMYYFGDVLGILLVAPPMVWLFYLRQNRTPPVFGPPRAWVRSAAILAVASLLVAALSLAGFGLRLVPFIIAIGIIGASFGRALAWAAVLAVSLTVLTITALDTSTGELSSHLQLVTVAVMGYLAGSYCDDQRRLREEVRLRDIALLQSERLRTLRAMSVAVIHELSQPLSTLSIETKYLAQLAHSGDADLKEVRQVSELVAEKTESLANMLRRLRSFGEATNENSAIIEVEDLVRKVISVIAAEATAAGVRIEMWIKEKLAVHGQDVELQQALTNLLRNAIIASPGGTVKLSANEHAGGNIRIEVVNTPSEKSPYRRGMGVGKLIVESIAQMHGGSLLEEQGDHGERRMSLILPSAESVKG